MLRRLACALLAAVFGVMFGAVDSGATPAPGRAALALAGAQRGTTSIRVGAATLRLRGGGPESPQAGFEIHYRCSRKWGTAFVHYSLDEGATWSLKPDGAAGGDIVQSSHAGTDTELTASPAGVHWKRASISASAQTLCFVFHDGKGTWDSGPEGKYYRVEKPGRYALKDGRLSAICEGLPGVLIVTDLDGTYIGDEGAIAELNDCWQRQCVYSLPQASEFVYNTGRSWESARKVMEELKHVPMLTPRAVIASVGTEVWWVEEAASGEISAEKDEEWESVLASGGSWDRDLVSKLVQPYIERDWCHLRPADEQNKWKLVLGVKAVHVQELVAQVEEALAAQGKTARLIASGHGEWNYLDIVAFGAGKCEAMVYVRKKLGFDAAHTVACGDSGNDILMLSGEERGIVVGNAQEGLMSWVRARPDVARDGSLRLVHAEATHARGMVQGLRLMGFLPQV